MNTEPETANPYVGLRPFEQDDSLYFFGRREQVVELLEQLHRTHFLAVIGSSGCGKSSLIRAGLIPSLLGGFLVEERDAWQIAIMKPGDAPRRNLATALCQAFDKAPDEARIVDLHKAMVADHTPAVVSYLMPQLGANTNLLVLIDQFEEIFSFRGAEEDDPTLPLSRQQRRQRAYRRAEADDFVDLVLGLKAAIHLPVYTVLTMRTDFLGDCDLFYGLPEAMNECRYLVPRLSRPQLRQAIEGPARLAAASMAPGLRDQPMAPRLLDRLLNQLGDRTDRLPVLQHALLRTWDIWCYQGPAEGPMDLDHYEAAGTLQNALSQHADEALRSHDLDTTAKIFKCLTDTDAHQRRVRRPARLSELAAVAEQPPEVIRAILERFCAGGRNFLVISATAEANDPRVDISHESLIRQWDTLKAWVDAERKSRNQLLDLVRNGQGYRLGERALLQAPELQLALDWRATTRPTAAWAERYCRRDDDFDVAMQYLEQSRQAKDKAAKRRRRFHLLLWVTGILLVLSPVIYDVYQNFYSNYFYLTAKEGHSEYIEFHQGSPAAWDFFNLQGYIAETDYQRSQIEPSRLFNKKDINDYSQMHTGLIEILKPVEKLKSYWHHGETDKAFSAIVPHTNIYPEYKHDIIGVMSSFRSLKTVEKLKDYLLLNDTSPEYKEIKDIHETIVDTMAMLPTSTIMATLLSAIEDDNYPSSVRHAMVEALERISHADFAAGHADKIQSTLALLVPRASNDAAEQRMALRAAQTLMRLGDQEGDQEAVNQLILLAREGHAHIRREALEALAGNTDERVVAFLHHELDKKNPNPYLRRRVVEALAQAGGPDVVDRLINSIADESVRIRQSAVQALGRTGTPRAVAPLLARLRLNVQEEAAAEEEDELIVRQHIVEALGRLENHSASVQFLLENVLLADDDSPYANPTIARMTTEALEQIGNAAMYEALVDKLQERDIDDAEMSDEGVSRSKRGLVIDLLGRLGDVRAIPDLKTMLANNGSKSDGMRQNAAVALGRLGEASAIGPLIKSLDTAKDRMRLNVMGVLGRLGHQEALAALQSKVQQGVDRQDIIYLGTLVALGQLSDARVLDDLTTWLQQGESLMRQDSLETLVGPSMARWIERRIASESGAEGDVRQAAVEILGEFGSIRPVELLLARLSDGSIFVRRGAARALGRLGKRDIRVVEQLLVHLHDSDSGVRQYAAEALGQLGHPKAVTPLIAVLQDSDGDVRREAAQALGRLGDARAQQPLLRLLRGAKGKRQDGVEDVRRAALLAFAKIGLASNPDLIGCEARAVFNNETCNRAVSEHTASEHRVSEHERMRLAAAVVLLALQPHHAPDVAVEALLTTYADPAQALSLRKELAEMLGEFPTAKGSELLLKLLDDTTLSVQEHALKGLGQARGQDVLPKLYRYLRGDNFRLQKAAAEALAEIAAADSIDAMAAVASASNPQVAVSIPARLASLNALYHIAKNKKPEDDARKNVIEKMLAAVKSEADQAILGIRAYNLLGDLQARQALDALQARLQEQVTGLRTWRRKREAPQDQTRAGQAALEQAKLARHLAFELAYNIARIDPETRGMKLLGHDLADIRQGAWQGLGSVGSVALLAELYRQLQDSDQAWWQKPRRNDTPFFRHAAYQAIDRILLRLETEGVKSKAELETLKELAPEHWRRPVSRRAGLKSKAYANG